MQPSALSALFDALADICDAEGRESARQTAAALRAAPPLFDPQPPTPFGAAIRALAATSPLPAAERLLDAQDLIAWDRNPVVENCGPTAGMFTVATFLGPEGPVLAPDLRCGLFYLRPGVYYPLHDHDADETYVILAGRAIWTAGSDTRLREAGEMIHHPSLTPHAFRTGTEGILAFWRWSGDINTHSYRFLPDPAA